MILKTKETTIAYRCPGCGAGVLSAVGIFALSGDMFRLKCDCGRSEMDVHMHKDGKLRIEIPCMFCPKPHNYVVSPSLFFGREVFLLPCSITGIDIGFVGGEEAVRAELTRTEEELRTLLEENGIDSLDAFSQKEKPELFSDPQIYDIIMFVVKDLEEEGKIHCGCDNGSYAVEIFDDHIRVYCENCNSYIDVPTDSTIAANAFLNTEELNLTEKE